MGLAGFLVALSDRGGAYRARATTMGILTITAAISAMIGAQASLYAALAVGLMLLFAFLSGLVRVYGDGATSIGASTAIVFAISSTTPSTGIVDTLERGGFVLVGGVAAMLLALALWPIAYYRPARETIADVYRALADYADDIVRYAARVTTDPQSLENDKGKPGSAQQASRLRDIDQRILFQRAPALIRQTLETARITLANTRRGRHGESGRGERLLVMLEGADQLFRALVAIADLLEDITYVPYARNTGLALQEAIREYAETTREITTVLEIEKHAVALPELIWGADTIRAEIAAITERTKNEIDPEEIAHVKAEYEYAAVLIDRLQQYTRVIAANVSTINTERPVSDDLILPATESTEKSVSFLDPILDVFSKDSVVLRHSLRLGIVTAIAIWITRVFSLDHGYWVTLTVLVTLQPHLDDTTLKGVQRVGGTVLGGLLAAILIGFIHNPVALIAIVFILVIVSVSLIPVNYGAFSLFSTSTFVLLAEIGIHDPHIVTSRMLNAFIGGALSLIAIRLFWPSWERTRFPDYMAAALRANQRYLKRVTDAVLLGDEAAKSKLMSVRRQVGLAELNVEASFQRVLSEPKSKTAEVESSMTALLYTRRVSAAITTLSAVHWDHIDQPWRDAFARLSTLAQSTLDSVAVSVERGRPPEPLPNFTALIQGVDPQTISSNNLIVKKHMERLVRQLRVLHDAVQRMLTKAR